MSRRRRKSPPAEPVITEIESLSHDGRGVSHVNGKTVFVDGALPGEQVEFQYTQTHGRFDEAKVLSVLSPSADRVEAKCPHAALCGGCSLQHMAPAAQVAYKHEVLLEQFTHIGEVQPETVVPPMTGAVWAYRRKARLGVRYVHKKGGVLVGFREKRNSFITDINSCPILIDAVGQHIMALRELISQLSVAKKIAQIEVAASDAHTALVFRNLEPLSAEDETLFQDFFTETGLHIYLQSGGLHTIAPLYPEAAQPLYYALPEQNLKLRFLASDFTQVNADINRQMINRALAWLDPQADETVLELFCGLGNFTLPLAQKAEKVIAVEGDAGLIERAGENAAENQLTNIHYHVADLMDADSTPTWAQETYQKVLLDPPRSGALEVIQKLDFSGVNKLLYISCSPATLARDAGVLVRDKGFSLSQAGIMDMFPHTAHVESIALFEK
ncbi:23S rRNA (uracil(1939)-C(5))-methyltransferase RlmD [Candidatus Venteria ishoeyi]|uniref:23S rRNA (uracil(1939)-C(5))-methyltransferase RlmD n=1 Tax=Candidatus Venteria ishoeyi TaxID=1899563 RepID=A0A1H6FE80_9GAMM|nr:23S rRNA (uracil(1939)-C(5))-methyltransferase RlmD [Candidatus Venteria ishoeyi]MDM8547550.1 23S rRNA (uracil(1939)-C(5))-methyltransferase RlmD [Candidatus Venteria ishoeyi]SEH08372.1 23S rRNA (uracil(1939)-C(5))-methyltransferase RlmD [Candidatus Venteria ishoeyi]